ncbi:NAD(P)/FAD-dependent oxidoreductase [Magnetovibrio blakemorei]|uniref:FAD-dependent oxidoreductase n=1 Tax=Magnetovibrio blakemorei TaxID=28181 RepID=A0A1E5Q3Y8_9PROT|nr:NAD(P)/FAD-dependent oxidoreductase [Magnetovibrio blakemorei]OEJ64331.1 FAD-dependent oxidoreductase [Magnetovibrio blakemorei]
MTEKIECLVIGAGVVGLAIARTLALRGHDVIVVEAEPAIGTITSARNSEVIHAGLYYPPGSLKGQLCVQGNALLYDYVEHSGINHQRCGKLVVATSDDEVAVLKGVVGKAAANGCTKLDWLEGPEARALEPELTCLAALSSPTTGIIDTHGFMLSLLGELEAHGGWVALSSPALSGEVRKDGFLMTIGGTEPMDIECTTLINSAGLDAQAVAGRIKGFDPHLIPKRHLCKGNYFSLSGRAPFSRLVYPVPGTASLGCHYTRDLGGQGRFGPDAEWVEAINYDVDARRADAFYAEIRRYWPGLKDGALTPAYSGMRPKLQAPGEGTQDFSIQGPAVHGIKGLVNLYGIESPGLTSSLAIGAYVADMV